MWAKRANPLLEFTGPVGPEILRIYISMSHILCPFMLKCSPVALLICWFFKKDVKLKKIVGKFLVSCENISSNFWEISEQIVSKLWAVASKLSASEQGVKKLLLRCYLVINKLFVNVVNCQDVHRKLMSFSWWFCF